MQMTAEAKRKKIILFIKKSPPYAARGQSEIFRLPGNWNCNCGTFKIGVACSGRFSSDGGANDWGWDQGVRRLKQDSDPRLVTILLLALVREQGSLVFFSCCLFCHFRVCSLFFGGGWGCIITGRLQHDATRVQMAHNSRATFARVTLAARRCESERVRSLCVVIWSHLEQFMQYQRSLCRNSSERQYYFADNFKQWMLSTAEWRCWF